MQTINLTDTDELPKRNVTSNAKPSMLQDPKQNNINMNGRGGKSRKRGNQWHVI